MKISQNSVIGGEQTPISPNQLATINKNWRIFCILFIVFYIFTSSQALTYLFKNYDNPHSPYAIYIFILGMLRIISLIGMVVILSYFAYKFSQRKIWIANGLLGVLAFFPLFPLIGFALVFLQKTKRINEQRNNL